MTINEIAQMAGVSRATVSRYLNDGYVSDEKRERIAAVIRKTGYTPSVSAQLLRSHHTNFIGVIIPKLNSDSISRMADGISTIAPTNGNADGVIYNLNGIRMAQPLRNLPKGVYIVNGKKVIK